MLADRLQPVRSTSWRSLSVEEEGGVAVMDTEESRLRAPGLGPDGEGSRGGCLHGGRRHRTPEITPALGLTRTLKPDRRAAQVAMHHHDPEPKLAYPPRPEAGPSKREVLRRRQNELPKPDHPTPTHPKGHATSTAVHREKRSPRQRVPTRQSIGALRQPFPALPQRQTHQHQKQPIPAKPRWQVPRCARMNSAPQERYI